MKNNLFKKHSKMNNVLLIIEDIFKTKIIKGKRKHFLYAKLPNYLCTSSRFLKKK